MNYKLLVADDNELVRSEVRSKLKDFNIQFEEVKEASSVWQALELLKEWRCHVMIVSCQMSDGSGFDLIERAKEMYPHIKFIAMDNSRDFACAKRAIDLEVSAYLEKPISEHMLKTAMTKIFTILQDEEYIERAVRVYKIAEKEKQESWIEKEVNCILSEREENKISPNVYPMLFEHYRWLFQTENYYYVALIDIGTDNFEEKYGKKDLELLRFSIKNVFNELPTCCEKIIVDRLDSWNQLYCLFGGPDVKILRKEIEKILMEMKRFFEVKMKVKMGIGVSEAAKDLDSLKCKEAQEVLEHGRLYDCSNLFFYKDICDMKKFKYPTTELISLRQHLERRNVEKVEAVIEELFSAKRVVEYHISYVHVMWMNILSILMQIVENDAYGGNVGRKILKYYSLTEDGYSIKELKKKYINLVSEYVGYKSLEECDAKNKIKMSVRYLDKHYYSDISVNQLAELYDMTPNYFSSLFKKEMGQSTVAYITNLRISKAKELLEKTDKNVVEIADLIGYKDSNYFFRVFKKNAGVTPQQYRVIKLKTKE